MRKSKLTASFAKQQTSAVGGRLRLDRRPFQTAGHSIEPVLRRKGDCLAPTGTVNRRYSNDAGPAMGVIPHPGPSNAARAMDRGEIHLEPRAVLLEDDLPIIGPCLEGEAEYQYEQRDACASPSHVSPYSRRRVSPKHEPWLSG